MRLFSSAFSSQQKTLSGVFISQRRPGLGDYIHAALEPLQGSTRQTAGLCPPCVRFAQSQVPAFHRQRGSQHYFPWNSYLDTSSRRRVLCILTPRVRFTQSQVRAFHRQRGSQHYFPWNRQIPVLTAVQEKRIVCFKAMCQICSITSSCISSPKGQRASFSQQSDTSINSRKGEGYCVFQRHVSHLLIHKFVYFNTKRATNITFPKVSYTMINSIGEGSLYDIYQYHERCAISDMIFKLKKPITLQDNLKAIVL